MTEGAVPLRLLMPALLAGVLGGAAALAFREALRLIQLAVYGLDLEVMTSAAAALPPWHLLLATTLGGLVVGLFVRRFLPGGRPQGVADVQEHAAGGAVRLSLPTGLTVALASVLSFGAGASVGREGPIVHLGASLATAVSRRARLPAGASRILLGCGVAAAVAASFNAPLAGAVFALEVVAGRYAFAVAAPVFLSAVLGTLLSRLRYGADTAFLVPDDWAIVSLLELPAFALLGLLAAGLAYAFVRSVFAVDWLARRSRLPRWSWPAVGGLALGLIALAYPQVMGVGYEATSTAIAGGYGLWLLVGLAVAKTAATAISLGSGFVGGVFSPSLFLGAMLGGAFGHMAAAAVPSLASEPGAYVLIGMGALAGVVLGAPISTIVMMVELTGNVAFTLAMALATVLASLAARQLGLRSFFAALLERRAADQSSKR